MKKGYNKLIDDYKKLANKNFIMPNNNNLTFMMVAGFPHREIVWSNILAFFLKDDEVHGFSNLWLKSLLDIIGGNIKIECVDVMREYHTDKNGRIDILLESPNCDIIIENKVYSGICNDLDDYQNTVKNRNEKDKEIKCILLSLKKYSDDDLEKRGWVNITYKELIDKVKDNLGDYSMNADSEWFIFMKDFIKTVLKEYEIIVGEKTMEYNKDILEFLQNNEAEINIFMDNMYDVKRTINKKADDITQLIISKLSKKIRDNNFGKDITDDKSCFIWSWHSPRWQLYSAAVIQFRTKELNDLRLQVEFSSDCRVTLYFERPANAIAAIENELKKHNINFERRTNNGNRIIMKSFSIDTDDDEIMNTLENGVDFIMKTNFPKL